MSGLGVDLVNNFIEWCFEKMKREKKEENGDLSCPDKLNQTYNELIISEYDQAAQNLLGVEFAKDELSKIYDKKTIEKLEHKNEKKRCQNISKLLENTKKELTKQERVHLTYAEVVFFSYENVIYLVQEYKQLLETNQIVDENTKKEKFQETVVNGLKSKLKKKFKQPGYLSIMKSTPFVKYLMSNGVQEFISYSEINSENIELNLQYLHYYIMRK